MEPIRSATFSHDAEPCSEPVRTGGEGAVEVGYLTKIQAFYIVTSIDKTAVRSLPLSGVGLSRVMSQIHQNSEESSFFFSAFKYHSPTILAWVSAGAHESYGAVKPFRGTSFTVSLINNGRLDKND